MPNWADSLDAQFIFLVLSCSMRHFGVLATAMAERLERDFVPYPPIAVYARFRTQLGVHVQQARSACGYRGSYTSGHFI